MPDRAGQAARADAAQRPQGLVSGRRAPWSVRVYRGAGDPVLGPATLALVRAGAVCARHHRDFLPRPGDPRAEPQDGIPHQVAQQAVPVRIRAAELGQPVPLRREPHLPPSLHPASRGRPRGGAAGQRVAALPADAAVVHLQRVALAPQSRPRRPAADPVRHRAGRIRRGRRRVVDRHVRRTSRRRSARRSGGRARSWRFTAPFSWWRS